MTNSASVLSNVGKVRSNNQDSAYSGRNLFMVADGMGGHAGGDVASAITVNQLAELDHDYDTPSDAVAALTDAMKEANQLLISTVMQYPELHGMGTTASAILTVGNKLALAHIGDSRIYVWRDKTLTQVSKDHTFVQKLVDAGRITPEEATVHPRRNVVMRVLGDVDMQPDIDVAVIDLKKGDRWLLCSDGLSGVVFEKQLTEILSKNPNRDRAAAQLLQAALDNGAPDNVTVLLVDTGTPAETATEPRLVGSADSPLTLKPVETALPKKSQPGRSSAWLTAMRSKRFEPTQYESAAGDYLEEIIAEDRRRRIRRRITIAVTITLIAIGLAIAAFAGYQWTRTQYFVGVDNGYVAVFNGVSQDIGPLSLHTEVELADLPRVAVDSLPYDSRVAVQNNIPVDSLADAIARVNELAKEVAP